jgi:hypothetical protein
MPAYGPGTAWIVDITKEKARKRLEEAAAGPPVSGMPANLQPRAILAAQRAGAHDQGEMESRLATPAYDVAPPGAPDAAAAGAGVGEAADEMGEDEFSKFMNQAFMAAMMKRKDVPFPGGRIAGSVKAAPGPEPMRRPWEKDYRVL